MAARRSTGGPQPMVGGASRVAMFPVALNALTPTSPPGKPQPCLRILGEIHLGGALAAAVHALPLLGRRGGILAQTVLAVLPEALLAAREAAHEVGVATRLGHEALLVVRDVLALADVQLVSARGLVPGRRRSYPRPSTGWARSSAGSRWAGRSWEPREGSPALSSLILSSMDASRTTSVRGAFPTREPGAAAGVARRAPRQEGAREETTADIGVSSQDFTCGRARTG